MNSGTKIFAIVLLSFLTSCATVPTVSPEEGEEFRALVARYQLFVVPLCKPDTVSAYNNENADRDEEFISSLRRTPLYDEYRNAADAFLEKEKQIIRHCSSPPTPPGRPVPTPAEEAAAEAQARDMHFVRGDETFAQLVVLRDRILTN